MVIKLSGYGDLCQAELLCAVKRQGVFIIDTFNFLVQGLTAGAVKE